MSEEHLHLEEAKKLYQKAVEEFEIARDKNDATFLRDACAKGWLSAIEAINSLFIRKGVKEEEILRTDRGRRFMVNKYAEREFRLYYFSLRDNLHVVGYYDGTLDFDEMERYLDDLNTYIQKVEELKGEASQ